MKVFIESYGIINANGLSIPEFEANIFNGVSGIKTLTNNDYHERSSKIGGEVATEHIERLFKNYKKEDKTYLLAKQSVMEALSRSGLNLVDIAPERKGIVVGSSYSGSDRIINNTINYTSENGRKIGPQEILKSMGQYAGSKIAMEYDLQGFNLTIDAACASSLHALGFAYQQIKLGTCDLMFVVGADAPLHPVSLLAWTRLRALGNNTEPKKACKPFARDRSGTILAEGAGTVLVMSESLADHMNITPAVQLCGYGFANDTTEFTKTNSVAMKKAMQGALSNHDITDIDYIAAHGTATAVNDFSETEAIKALFGDYAYNLKINALKSMCGHTIGAAGVTSVIATLLQMKHNKVHPTINLDDHDALCDLDYVPGKTQDHTINHALVNAFALGGSCASVMLKRCIE